MSVAGLILAGGESRRMGYPKALLRFRGETFLDSLIAALGGYCCPIVVVLGARAEEIRGGLQRGGEACIVVNENYPAGQITSMQCGLRAIPADAEGVLFTLVDHPRVRPSTLAALLAKPPAAVAAPCYGGRRGHPVFFSRELIVEFLALSSGESAKTVFERHRDETRFIDVDDPGIVQDIDEPDDYRRLVECADD